MPEPIRVMLLTAPGEPHLLGSYERAFRRIGCRVHAWDFEKAKAQQVRLGEFGRRFHEFVTVEPWLRKASRDLVVEVRRERPDLVGVAGTAMVTAGALAQIRASVPATKLVLFWPDPLQNLGPHTVQALPMYDLIATYARSSVDPLLRLGARKVEWVPFAADLELFETARNGSSFDCSLYACDVGFIGNLRPEREAAILALQEAGIHVRVWGENPWLRRLGNKAAAKRYWEGRAIYGTEFAQATQCFRLALNVIDDTNYPAANMRFFETLASGGTLLTSSCPELEPQFPDGVAAFYFDSNEHLVALAKGLLGAGARPRQVADEGLRRVASGHTYVDRARQVLRSVEVDVS